MDNAEKLQRLIIFRLLCNNLKISEEDNQELKETVFSSPIELLENILDLTSIG